MGAYGSGGAQWLGNRASHDDSRDWRVSLYRQIYELTNGHCGCTGEYGCCAPEHCEKARAFALRHHGIELQDTGHRIPFMGPQGCTIPPELRPVCTLHVCHLYAAKAEFPGDPERTARYFELRNRVLDEAKSKNQWPFP